MSTDPGMWGWTSDIGHIGFTVTFTLGRDPQEVLSLYGTGDREAQVLTREEAWMQFPPNQGGAQLRAGTLGRWGFCFEEASIEGMKSGPLSRLSAETETIALFAVPGRSDFTYLKDGLRVESFDPGNAGSVQGDQPYTFWTGTQKIMSWARSEPTPPIHAVLQTIAKYIREPLDRNTLEGPLLTAFLPDSERAPLDIPYIAPRALDLSLTTAPIPSWLTGAHVGSLNSSTSRAHLPTMTQETPAQRQTFAAHRQTFAALGPMVAS